VTDSVNGVPGSSISMSDLVNSGQADVNKQPAQEERNKLSNQDIMNVINSLD
jgi:hypothetical protein